MDIRCRKTRCKFNNKYACMAKEILVKKNCECEKFVLEENKPVEDKTKKIFSDNPPEYAIQRDRSKLDIVCRAHCLFNDNGVCVANGISLNEIKEKPLCTTFLRK